MIISFNNTLISTHKLNLVAQFHTKIETVLTLKFIKQIEEFSYDAFPAAIVGTSMDDI